MSDEHLPHLESDAAEEPGAPVLTGAAADGVPEPSGTYGAPRDEVPAFEPPDPAATAPTEPTGTEAGSSVEAPAGPPPWPAAPAARDAVATPPPPPPPGPPFGPAPGGPQEPPSTLLPPSAPAPSPGRGRPWLVGIAAAVVGALVGGAVATGVTLATDDASAPERVVVRSGSGGNAATSLITREADVQSILAIVEPAVVAIRTGAGNGGGAGTGFVISSDGMIVTNNHVVDGASSIEVAFPDGTTEEAEVLGTSEDNDLAVLDIGGDGYTAATLCDSDALEVGDEVVAIGNALALEGGLSVTRGIISAKGRTVPTETGATLFDVLQTDAAINPGNSGGPLVNSRGEVCGINTAIANPSEAQNVGFAISVNSAKPVIEDLRQGRSVQTAFLGVQTQAVTAAVASQLGLTTEVGAVVVAVTDGSGAQAAGIQENDVILEVSGTTVRRPDDVGAGVRKHRPGEEIEVTLERDGEQRSVTVQLGTRPNE